MASSLPEKITKIEKILTDRIQIFSLFLQTWNSNSFISLTYKTQNLPIPLNPLTFKCSIHQTSNYILSSVTDFHKFTSHLSNYTVSSLKPATISYTFNILHNGDWPLLWRHGQELRNQQERCFKIFSWTWKEKLLKSKGWGTFHK